MLPAAYFDGFKNAITIAKTPGYLLLITGLPGLNVITIAVKIQVGIHEEKFNKSDPLKSPVNQGSMSATNIATINLSPQ